MGLGPNGAILSAFRLRKVLQGKPREPRRCIKLLRYLLVLVLSEAVLVLETPKLVLTPEFPPQKPFGVPGSIAPSSRTRTTTRTITMPVWIAPVVDSTRPPLRSFRVVKTRVNRAPTSSVMQLQGELIEISQPRTDATIHVSATASTIPFHSAHRASRAQRAACSADRHFPSSLPQSEASIFIAIG